MGLTNIWNIRSRMLPRPNKRSLCNLFETLQQFLNYKPFFGAMGSRTLQSGILKINKG